MKVILGLLIMLTFAATPSCLQAASFDKEKPIVEQRGLDGDDLSKIALGSAILGAAFIAIPPLSLLGLGLSIIGLGLGIFSRRKAKKKLFAKIAIILSSIALGYFLLAVGLVAFY